MTIDRASGGTTTARAHSTRGARIIGQNGMWSSALRATPECGRAGAAPHSEALRIAVLCPPWFPVPPRRYGGIEAVVALLADGLVAEGHDVTLFASGGSTTSAHLVTAHSQAPSTQLGQTLPELEHVLSCIRRAGEFDVISDHSGPLAVALSEPADTPFVHTVHNALGSAATPAYDAALAFASEAHVVSLSHQQRRPRPAYPWIATIPNAVDLLRYPCRARAGGDHLVWIGRMCHDKGPDRAIAVARQAGLPILLAGKMHTPVEREYFDRRVKPQLGRSARYVGEADKDTVVKLLHSAIALLNPIEWAEPFGLVMIEAMACGVPVLVTRCGAAPEIIVDGVTGFIVDDHHAMADMLPALAAITPEACRAEAVRRFSPDLMVDRYLAAFRTVIASGTRSRAPRTPLAVRPPARGRPPELGA